MLLRSSKIPALGLPTDFRKALSLPQGTLYVADRGVVSGLRADVAVGDVVASRHSASVKIVDFKTKRKEAVAHREGARAVIVNPPGYVSLNSFTMLRMGGVEVFAVEGEEDMLVTAVAYLREGAAIIYGQPDVGVVYLVSDRRRALKVIKALKPVVIRFDRGCGVYGEVDKPR